MTRAYDRKRSRRGLDLRENNASQTTARLETPPDSPCSRFKVSAGRVRCTMKSRYQTEASRLIGTACCIGGATPQPSRLYTKTSNVIGCLRLRGCESVRSLRADERSRALSDFLVHASRHRVAADAPRRSVGPLAPLETSARRFKRGAAVGVRSPNVGVRRRIGVHGK